MKDLIISLEITIRQAMKALNNTAEKCLLVVDGDKKFLGTLTDGDLRRSILNSADFDDSIKGSYCSEPTILIDGKFTKQETIEIMISKKLDLLPILNDKKQVVDYITSDQIFGNNESQKKKSLAVPVVIMAGGKGTRLEPFTKVLPKPLVPIHEKPVIEHIIDRFTDAGVHEFILTVNYKALIMKAFFEELNPDYSIDILEEQEPLGTAGSMKFLVDKIYKPFIVTNCDIIIKTNYLDLYEYHQKNNYDITLVASMKNFTIPYGTCELNGEGHLKQINEKPEYNFLVNTGLYILSPDILHLIPEGKLYHITQLIDDAMKNGKRVGVFPVDDDAWIDVGQWAEYQKALEKL